MNYTHCSAHEVANVLQHFKTDNDLNTGIPINWHAGAGIASGVLKYDPGEGQPTPFKLVSKHLSLVRWAFPDGRLAGFQFVRGEVPYDEDQYWTFAT